MTLTDLLVALAIAVGLAGIVVPVLPGSVLVLGAIVVWAILTSTATGWVVAAAAALLLVLGGVVKYVVPGRRLSEAGVPTSTLWVGALLGIVGFFVIPVIGLIVGFVVGVYVAELRRVGSAAAWPSTVAALRAAGLSMLIEMVAGLLATGVWVVGVVLT